MARIGGILGGHGLARGPGAADAARLRRPHAVPARPRDAAPAARPRRGPRRQRERHRRRRRDPLRRQRPPRRARRRTSCRPTCSCCSPTRAGLFTADPRLDGDASLIEEIVEVDAALEAVAGGTGSGAGSGGMASKLAAAKIAAWSGVRAVIAGGRRARRGLDAIEGRAGRHRGPPRAASGCSSRKLWIAFAARRAGRDRRRRRRARARSCADGRSLLPAGVRGVEGAFDVDDAVEIVGRRRRAVRQGPGALLGADAPRGRRPQDHRAPEGAPHEVIHRDDLVVLP